MNDHTSSTHFAKGSIVHTQYTKSKSRYQMVQFLAETFKVLSFRQTITHTTQVTLSSYA